MNEQIEKLFVDTTLCDWCRIPLGTANLIRGMVCVRCYELLIKANLTNDEIFGGKKRKNENVVSSGYNAKEK